MELVAKDALMMIGLPVRATWQELWTEMPKAWRLFVDRHGEIAHRIGETFVDVSLEKNGEEYLQLICVQVSRVESIPEGMRAVVIPAQQYVHHKHLGPTPAIARSFGAIYTWAQQYGHAVDEFKLDFGYTVAGDELEHDLFVRIG